MLNDDDELTLELPHEIWEFVYHSDYKTRKSWGHVFHIKLPIRFCLENTLGDCFEIILTVSSIGDEQSVYLESI
jgi:hypothetical protein